MYLLDTNVISELRKIKSQKANKNFVDWLKTLPTSSLYLSAITILELEMGVLLKERKDSAQGKILRAWLEQQVLSIFSERILPIDTSVALRCAKLHVPNPQSDRDALIAATALTHGMTLVTRNTRDFDSTGVTLINPWEMSNCV